MDRYLRLVGSMPSSLEEQLPLLLAGQPVLGCQVSAGVDAHLTLEVYFKGESEDATLAVSQRLQEAGVEGLSVDWFSSQDWLASYRAQAQPFCVGRQWWIDPRPEARTRPPAGRLPLVIEPRNAFGTGTHESTKLVLEELEELSVAGSSVLDVGTGSGILAFAAQRLRASWALGLDNDQVAVWVARSGIRLQKLVADPVLLVGTLECLGDARFDIVLCNMLVESFLPLLPRLARLVTDDGVLVLSGILQADRVMVTREVEEVGLRVVAERQLGEWTCLRARVDG